MEKLVESLSRYQVFNNLIPGLIFVEYLKLAIKNKVNETGIATYLVASVFFGVLISRVGSIALAPVLHFFEKRENSYAEFCAAEKIDPKINDLLLEANFFRTMSSLALFCVATYPILTFQKMEVSSGICSLTLASGLVFVIFAISSVKQNQFISRRVKVAIQDVSNKDV